MSEPQEITATELRRVPIWRSFVVRSIGLLVLLTIGMVCLTAFWIHEEQKREVIDKFGLALESTAATAAPFISAADVTAIQEERDATNAAFARIRNTLEIIRVENHLEDDQIYILRRDPGGDHHLTFVAMLQDETFIGHRYNPPREIIRYYNWVFETADAIRTDLYTDDHGTYISGIAPIVDERGRVVAVLQVDYPVDLYLAEVDRRSNILLAGGGTLIVLIALLGLFIQFQLRRKIGQLLAGTHAISREDYDYRISIAGGDELRVLADALNRTMGRLKERFEMLKFLPSHTAKMIETKSREGGVRLEEGQLVEVAVLESDIRGFTKLSSTLTPVEVIAMLNLYIRVQADIIVSAGGSVDKFMGDAVLAVFEGPERSTRALGAALAIQEAVRDMNERGVFARPICIGIGLSEGEVVMGNMGSDQRMEYTVIGSVVNLAARLCSAANAGEVVAQATLLDHSSGVADGLQWQPDEIIAKGFADPVPCVRIGVTAPKATTSGKAPSENRAESAE